MRKNVKAVVKATTLKRVSSKAFNLTLARDLTAGRVLDPDEKAELTRIYSRDEDRTVGEEIYKLRTMGKSKFEICKILSVDPRTIDRLYGTLTYSEYFKLRIDDALSGMNADGSMGEAVDGEIVVDAKLMDDEQFKEYQKGRLKQKMDKLLTGITPDKIYDAGIKDIGDTYQKLHAAYRLEQGKSTQNIQVGAVMVHTKMNKESYKNIGHEVMHLGKEILKIDSAIKRLEAPNDKPEE